jgi:Family of unknown function (DUF5996)
MNGEMTMQEKKRATVLAHDDDIWPALPLAAWSDTYATLHMWTQIVGKIRLKQSPPVNHWWQVPLYVTARGLTTSSMPYGRRTLQIDFDFIDHMLVIRTGEGDVASLPLVPQSVAAFYRSLMATLRSLGVEVKIWTMPVEVPNPIRFTEDEVHAAYDAEYAQRFWRILLQVDRVLKTFRGRFIGKCSPVHFFWGGADLAVTRFSGRRAPMHPGGIPNMADFVTREAYSHEVSSAGFWPGGRGLQAPMFYAYAYPEPAGFREAAVRPGQAYFNPDLGEFVLLYDDVRRAPQPDVALLEFLQSTYEAAAGFGNWDRAALERASSSP